VAIITQKQLIEKLEATGVKVEYQTSGLFAQLQAWDKMKQDEFEMAKKVLTVNQDKKFPVAYNFEVSVGTPERNGDYYYVDTKIMAKPNANYEAIINNAKALLNEIAYEAKEYSYFMDMGHASSSGSTFKIPYSTWINVKQEVSIKKNGKKKVKKNYQRLDLNFPEYEPPTKDGDQDYFEWGRASIWIEFLGSLDYEAINSLGKKKFEKLISQEDKNRLNDNSIMFDRHNYTYDIFEKNYTPYLFIIREPKKITVYKFINPATNKVVGKYLSFLLEAMHFKTVLSMNGADNMELITPLHRLIMYSFRSELKTTTPDIYTHYKGYVLETLPRVATFDNRVKLSAEDFQKITNIAVEPSYTGYTFFETVAE
ncbi:MAG: hypothetical protein PF450_14475, partial [Bacteroidales bacterium]|nr:hypothetical protein [Bacteroidales bacterium]